MSNFLTGLAQLNPQVKRHNGGTSTFTLDQSGTTNATLLFVNGVAQTPGTDFNVSGATLTTTSALPAGTNIATTIQYFNTGIVNTVADDAIGLAQMASGTDGNIISYDASGNPVAVATGSDGQVLTSAGAGAPPAFEAIPAAGVTLGTAVATTSGTTFDFTGIPSGTKRITVNLAGVHFNAGVWPLVQIGDSGGVETSGYSTVCCYLSASVAGYLYTNGWNWLTFGSAGATYLYSGTIILTLVDPATYSWAGSLLTTAAGTVMGSAAGDKSLSAELDRVRITTNSGGSAFDAGKVNITYE